MRRARRWSLASTSYPVHSGTLVRANISATARESLDPGVTWFGWTVPPLLEVAIVLLLGVAMIAVAVWKFARTE